MSISLRRHKRRACAGMARRLDTARANGLRYGPACHPFYVILGWVWKFPSRWSRRYGLYQRDECMVNYTRAVPRGREADRAPLPAP